MGIEPGTLVEESTEPPIGLTEKLPDRLSDRLPHTATSASLERVLTTNLENGLTSTEARLRLERDGFNSVDGAKGPPVWKLVLRQVSNSLTVILLSVMIMSFVIHDFIEASVIAAVVTVNIIVGLVQDYRAEQTIQSLYALSAPTCKVIRDGRIETIKAAELVCGDVVKHHVGDIVPADMRLVDGLNLMADESLLTGESCHVRKQADEVVDEKAPVGDRVNMLYSASTITRGRGTGVVTATGMQTEVGKIAEMLRTTKTTADQTMSARLWTRSKELLGLVGTPLQIKLSKFALLLFGLAILLVLIVFAVHRFQIDDQVLIYGICAGVAVIPESLIAVLTVVMAVSTKAMAKGNVIVRNLSSLEAIGAVTHICCDKTGTLTQGKMMVREIWLSDRSTATVRDCTDALDPLSGTVSWDDKPRSPLSTTAKTLLKCIALCNNSTVTEGKPSGDDTVETSTMSTTVATASSTWRATGEPTEIALNVFAMRFGKSKTVLAGTLLAEHPFDSSSKRMSVVYAADSGVHVYTKGALEAILPLLDASDEVKAEFVREGDRMAAHGLRVLCIAHKCVPRSEDVVQVREVAESKLRPLGLAGLHDPPRAETAECVRLCKLAGISLHMVTGDHVKTAESIAREVGLAPAGAGIVAASTFDAMSDDEIDRLEKLPVVLARCSPSTKVRMVEAMHRRGAFCVMTGDGVNDSPALKKSDVGIAMGLNGSDVAKEAADMVLVDDNFASITKAVEEGRRLFDNIQKFLLHLLISNIAQVVLLLSALALRDDAGSTIFPLSPLEILWANLVTSSFLAIGLGLEEAQADIMTRPPQDMRVGVFSREMLVDKMVYGCCMGSLCLAAFVTVTYGRDPSPHVLGRLCNDGYNNSCEAVFRARATTFATLTFALLVTAWEVKHRTLSLFAMNPDDSRPLSVFRTVYRNKFLFGAVLAGFLITFPVIYLPKVDELVFKHKAITWEWGVVLACTAVYVMLVETWKAGKRRFGHRLGNRTPEDDGLGTV